jgi:hypothetical protein
MADTREFSLHIVFIGVICQNIEESQQADQENQQQIKMSAQLQKKEAFLVKQRSDMKELLARSVSSFQRLTYFSSMYNYSTA